MVEPSMKACMDSSNWLKSIVSEERGMDSSSPSMELITCYSSPPVPERRLRPPHDQALKCPRCDSTHTKFCYYNNYSLSQPRYFCKTCRRYWTKGGSLRNVPVGGGCRKNKRSSSKKPTEQALINHQQPIDLHLSYNPNFGSSVSGLELVESKFGAMFGGSKTHLFMGGSGSDMSFHVLNPLGFPIDGNHGSLMEAWQRFDGQEDSNAMEVKPVDRMLSLEWQEQGCAEVGRDSFGCSSGLGLWAGMINGQGPLNG